MGKRTIIFYAPVGTNLPVHLLGGGEKGCRRTREILSNAGYNVITMDKLEQTIKEYRLDNDKVQIIGQQPFDKICDALQKVHFFVFPSQEKMEGHSNSLTEAMTFGVVPVVSTAGFNASIVGNKELVVDSIDPMKYARVIESVIEKNVWSEYSLAVYRRIKENYTEDIVKKNILCAVDELK